MKTLSKTFLTGIATVIPIAVTVYVLWWLDHWTNTMLERVPGMPENVPHGLGIVAGLVLIFVVGLLMRAYIVRSIFNIGESILRHIPLVKTLYGSMRDLMGYFANADDDRTLGQVVMVTLPSNDVRLIGFLTREDFSDLPDGIGTSETVAVYLPMSYQLGGFTTMLPRSAVEPIDMSMEDAMRFAVTAGMSGSEASTT